MFRWRVVVGLLRRQGFFLPGRAEGVPRGGPSFTIEARHLGQRLFRFGLVGVKKGRASPDALADIVFNFFDGSCLAHVENPLLRLRRESFGKMPPRSFLSEVARSNLSKPPIHDCRRYCFSP